MSVAKDTLLSLLLGFKPEFAHLAELEKAAMRIYGENWQEALNRDIIAMPARERDEYLPRWKVALAYEGAVKLWRRAEQVLGGSLPASMEAVGDIGKYDAALPRFGKLGEQMLIRLRLKLGLSPAPGTAYREDAPAPLAPITPSQSARIQAIKKPAASSPVTPAKAGVQTTKKIKIKKTVLARKQKERASTAPASRTKAPANFSQPEASNHSPLRGSHLVGAQQIGRGEEAAKRTLRTSFSENPEEAIFERLEEFVAESREVMAMLVLDGKHGSLEEYPYYGFIVDATRALAEKAEALGLHEKADFYRKALESEIVPGRDTRLDWQPSASSRKPISATRLDGGEAAKRKAKTGRAKTPKKTIGKTKKKS